MENYVTTTQAAAQCLVSRDSIVRWTTRLGIEPMIVFAKRLYTEEQYAALRAYAERRKAARIGRRIAQDAVR